MTVAKLPRVNEYQGVAGPMAFAIKFQFLASADISVSLRDPAGVEQAPSAGAFIISGGNGATGQVSFTGSTAGYTVVIRGRTEISQKTEYPYGNNFPSANHERAVDRAAMIDQEQQDQIDETKRRALMVPAGSDVGDIRPEPQTVIAFDDNRVPYPRPIGSFPVGPSGPANSTFTQLAQLKAADPTNGSFIRADATNPGTYTLVQGDFSADANDLDVVALAGVPTNQAAAVQDTSLYVPTFDKLSRTIVGQAYDAIETGGYDTKGIGGGRYNRLTGAGPFIATRWRRQSRNGQWFEKDERVTDVTHFGAKGDGSDSTAAMLAAFAWLNEREGRTLNVPRGSFVFSQDLRVTSHFASIIGEGKSASMLSGRQGAKIVLGTAIITGYEPDGRPIRTADGKVLFPRLHGIGVKPDGATSQKCIYLENCDNALLSELDVGPFSISNNAIVDGISTNWVQWTSLEHVFTNVNNFALDINLKWETDENEDHFFINACQLYIGKQPSIGAIPACIRILREPNRSAPFWNFHIFGRTHFLGWKAADNPVPGGPIDTSGIQLQSPNDGGIHGTLAGFSIDECFFEDVTYPIDMKRKLGDGANEGCSLKVSNTTFMRGAIAIWGRDSTKQFVALDGCEFVDMSAVVEKVTLNAGNRNRRHNTPIFDTEGFFGKHRYVYLDSMEGVTWYAEGVATVTSGATEVSISYALSAQYGYEVVTDLLVPNWATSVGMDNPTPTSATIRFGTAAPTGARVRWRVKIS
ncbi:hypothetical protein [Sphingomonas parapaucimobilis]|uniref:Pectate lyase superfamily protein domain-containing protein n=1 Tax=Sphingomonas parapaucimobilis NBRC 15100 TaxID=1219049 RepID=A0A0A1W5K7_9SPHN|nr:hypothetical protein [Sphingomonas parapaucimobilis]GAM00705.1 hypothetical protein SP5_035_01050 [Sphingomonas parapaucimobilis NBRC 15100]